MNQTTVSSYRELVERFPASRDYLIPILQELQDAEGYIPEAGVDEISRYLYLPKTKIYGVVTFYNQFKLNPPGKYQIQVCRGTACHVKGSLEILEALQIELGIPAGSTTKDGLFSLETVACLGACSIAPAITINGDFYGRLDKKKAIALITDIRKKEGKA
jgi:NADH-quinone oxidoreductase subunit E